MTEQFEDGIALDEFGELASEEMSSDAVDYLDSSAIHSLENSYASSEKDAPERLEAFLESMKPYQRQLLAIISFCENPQAVEEVCAHVAALQKYAVSVFEPASLCNLLENAGGLVTLDDEGNLFDPASVEPREVVEDGVVYYEIPKQSPQLFYKSTPEALALLDYDDRAERIEALLSERADFLFVIQAILELASAEGGTQIKDIEDAVLHDERFTGSKWRPNSFLNKLEEADAVVWDGSWKITAYGRDLLDGIVSDTLRSDEVSSVLGL